MRKIWDIHGGVHPPENKTQSNQTPIANIALPSELVIPLNQHIGSPAAPIVNVGDNVLKGALLAEPQGYVSAAVHASSSGTITAIEERYIPHVSGLKALCIVIQPDGKEEWIERSPTKDYKQEEPSLLVEKIRQAGIAGMGGAGFPTAIKMRPRADQHIDTLILNGTECEPYITADDVLMREKADQIIAGAEILAYILNNPNTILIGIEDNKPEAIAAMQKAAEGKQIEIVSFPTKYPSGGEKQLIQILTGKEVPAGKIPADIGIVLQNIGTAQSVYRAITFGEPLISRITTVVGEAVKSQHNSHVLIGTPMHHVLEQHGFNADNCARLIIGGPMMGYAMEHTFAPVIKTTNCLLVPSPKEMPAPAPQQPCIRCGMCAEACPASLLPQQLFWFSQSEDFERLESHNLSDCIECGACSFVCPSNIPLVQYYRASKGAIRHHKEEKNKAEHSRQRFEFRKERLEKAEIEKEAKREARKLAAEAAKKKLAEQADNQTPVKTLEPKKPNESDPEKNRAKLERAVSSAKSRAERAEKQVATAIEEAADSARIETLKARLKDATLKVADTEERLSDFSSVGISDKPENTIKEKLSANPIDKIKKSIETLEKRLTTANEKYREAEANGSTTADALKQGVTKLAEKLDTAKRELLDLDETSKNAETIIPAEENAADTAIAKAKARAQSMAAMSPEEKAKAQYESLKKRLEKAKLRLEKAKAESDENIDAFRISVEKLEAKLLDAQIEQTPL